MPVHQSVGLSMSMLSLFGRASDKAGCAKERASNRAKMASNRWLEGSQIDLDEPQMWLERLFFRVRLGVGGDMVETLHRD